MAGTRPEPVYISSEDENETALAPPRAALSRGVLPSIEGISASNSRRESLDNPHGVLARGPSAPRRGTSTRGDTTEDDRSRPSTAAETAKPLEDPDYKARKFAEQARIAEEFTKKYGKGGLRD